MVSGGQPFTAGRVCFFTLPPGYLSSKVSGLLTRGPIYEKSYEDLTNFLRLKKDSWGSCDLQNILRITYEKLMTKVTKNLRTQFSCLPNFVNVNKYSASLYFGWCSTRDLPADSRSTSAARQSCTKILIDRWSCTVICYWKT